MEKKTFNDMMANLPTTETDMTKVMVEMEDGRKGWISAEGLAQVMAGLMPVATTEKQGVMSAAMAGKVLPLVTKGTTNTKTIIKMTCKGKFCILVGLIQNGYGSTFLHLYVRFTGGSSTNKPYVKVISKDDALPFIKYELNDGIYELYFYLGSWGEFSAIPFTGTILSKDVVSEIPSTAQDLNIIE